MLTCALTLTDQFLSIMVCQTPLNFLAWYQFEGFSPSFEVSDVWEYPKLCSQFLVFFSQLIWMIQDLWFCWSLWFFFRGGVGGTFVCWVFFFPMIYNQRRELYLDDFLKHLYYWLTFGSDILISNKVDMMIDITKFYHEMPWCSLMVTWLLES